jgi:uncharacterized protein DUF3455
VAHERGAVDQGEQALAIERIEVARGGRIVVALGCQSYEVASIALRSHMKTFIVLTTTSRTRRFACATLLAAAFVATLPQRAFAQRETPPTVPVAIEVDAGQRLFMAGHAVGTQNYICLPSGGGFAWTLFGPQATLFHNDARQMMTHFLSPNPDEAGTLRATWQHSVDTSRVWARAIATSSDPVFVAQGAIPWLLLEVMGAEGGPTGGERLTVANYVHRLNTVGGIAPATGCSQSAHVGSRAFVPYEADYFFYRDQHRNDD